MSQQLYRHRRDLTSDFVPLNKRARYLTSETPGLPVGVPNLTSDYVNNPLGVDAQPNFTTNGRVQLSMVTRTRDQKFMNKYQFVWVDTDKENRPLLRSLQQMNSMLATEMGIMDMAPYEILDRFKLVGVMANNDNDLDDSTPMDRGPRASTLTVWGATHTYDYWSSLQRMLRPYDTCYFVLKKVVIPPGHTFQTDITVANYDMGNAVPFDQANQYRWQIIPYATDESIIPLSAYTSFNERTGEVYNGVYWHVGRAHEYAQIAKKAQHEVRKTPMDVARHTAIMHMNGTVPIIQFYLKILQPKCILDGGRAFGDYCEERSTYNENDDNMRKGPGFFSGIMKSEEELRSMQSRVSEARRGKKPGPTQSSISRFGPRADAEVAARATKQFNQAGLPPLTGKKESESHASSNSGNKSIEGPRRADADMDPATSIGTGANRMRELDDSPEAIAKMARALGIKDAPRESVATAASTSKSGKKGSKTKK